MMFSEADLQPLCCRHHHVRHEASWNPARHDDGVTEWTSPTGRKYEKPPEPYPGIAEGDADPPPF